MLLTKDSPPVSARGLFADFRDYVSLREEAEILDFAGDFDWPVKQRNVVANTLPCAQYLKTANQHSTGAEQRLVRSLFENVADLHWLQSYTAADFGQRFLEKYGFVEMMGVRGHFDNSAMSGGFLVIGPGEQYPRHHHVAEELYIPLTSGTYWMRDDGPFQERHIGEVIIHKSDEPHAMETLSSPLVALYLWRNGDLAQKSEY